MNASILGHRSLATLALLAFSLAGVGGTAQLPSVLGPSRAQAATAAPEAAYPNGVPWSVPGIIDFDNYDAGGQGVAYHTPYTTNPGGKYRVGGVGIESTTKDPGGNGFDVGWNALGNWYKYSVTVQRSATYRLDVRIAALRPGRFHVEDETGANLSGAVTVAATGGWQAWTTVSTSVALRSGAHTLKIAVDSDHAYNLDYMTLTLPGATPTLTLSTPTPTPSPKSSPSGESAYPSGVPWPIPGTIAFDNYDLGGQGVAYHTPANVNGGGQYRFDGVGIESDTDTGNGNGFNVGWNYNGNWYRYTVNVQSTGTFQIAFRIASGTPGGTFHIEDETGKTVTGPVTVAATGGLQVWTTVNGTAALQSGQHILKVVVDTGNGSYNFNVMTFTFGPPATPTPTASSTTAPTTTRTATRTSTPKNAPTPTATPAPTIAPTPAAASHIDWPTFGFSAARAGENPSETTLTPLTVGQLHLLWSYKIGDATNLYANTQPVIAANVPVGGSLVDIAYVGSEHGVFAAVDAASGTELWTKQLGTQMTACGDIPDNTYGITSAAAIDRTQNRVYVVDGQGILWAFDLATGNGAAGWPAAGVQVVDDPTLDHIWSALTFNAAQHLLFVTTASTCDIGKWHGAARAVDTAGARVVQTFYFATGSATPPNPPATRFGGGIWGWGGIAIDPVTQHLYGATGNLGPGQTAPYSNSVVEWDPLLSASLATEYPPNPSGSGDDDFGGSSVLYDEAGSHCLAAFRKEGILFAFDRTQLTSGPTTTLVMCAFPAISTPAHSSATHLLYFNNTNNRHNGPYVQGLHAFAIGPNCTLDPTPVWTQAIRAGLAPPTVAGGVVYDNISSKIEAFDAASGAPLWDSGNTVSKSMFTAPTVVNGHVYTVDWSGTLYAFGL